MKSCRCRWRRWGVGVFAVAVAVVSSVIVPSPAMASTWSYTLINTTVRTDAVAVPLVALPALALSAGSNKYFNASYRVSNPESFNIMQGGRIRCRRMSDDAAFYSVYTTRNATAAAAGMVQVHWLFAVPSTDSYACTLWGHAATSRGTGYRLNVSSGAIGVDGSTFPGGAEWRHTGGGTVPSSGSSYLLRKTWTAGGGTNVGANADVELTNNYGSPNNGRSATADVTLYATQLAADGTGCRPAVTVTRQITIPAAVHHDKIYLQLRGVAISAEAACTRNFAIKVLVKSVSGNPLVLEGSSGTHYSNGIAFSY